MTEIIKPIYDLTRKGRQFIWGEEQQQAFDKMKRKIVRSPVLHIPNNKDRFHLY